MLNPAEKLNISNIVHEESENGSVLVFVEDHYTKDWIQKLKFNELGIPLIKVEIDDIPLVRWQFTIRFRKDPYSIKEIFKQLQIGNKGLTIKKRTIFAKKQNADGSNIITIGIDKKAYEYIEAKNNRI